MKKSFISNGVSLCQWTVKEACSLKNVIFLLSLNTADVLQDRKVGLVNDENRLPDMHWAFATPRIAYQ